MDKQKDSSCFHEGISMAPTETTNTTTGSERENVDTSGRMNSDNTAQVDLGDEILETTVTGW